MNIAIIGKSKTNKKVAEYLENQGISTCVIESSNEVADIRGEAGNFDIKLKESVLNAAGIIFMEEISDKSPNTIDNDGSSIIFDLQDFNSLEKLNNKKHPAVILLDYAFESPAYMTEKALNAAIGIIRKRKKAVILYRFMRTWESGNEALYREARNCGVTFIRYDSIMLKFITTENVIKIFVKNDLGELSITTQAFIKAGSPVKNDNTLNVLKKMRLMTGVESAGAFRKHFLYPCRTNRKGIYYLDHISQQNSLIKHVGSIIEDILSESQGPSIGNGIYAEIEGEKCALCYTCYRACPHYAMIPDAVTPVMKNLKNSCQGCGICQSVCPASAISMKGRIIEKEASESEMIEILCCENSGEIAIKNLINNYDSADKFKISPVCCGGEVTVGRLIDSLKYNKKVVVISCMEKACRHFDGNKRAKKQVEEVKRILRASKIDENRVAYLSISHAMPNILKDFLNENCQLKMEVTL